MWISQKSKVKSQKSESQGAELKWKSLPAMLRIALQAGAKGKVVVARERKSRVKSEKSNYTLVIPRESRDQ